MKTDTEALAHALMLSITAPTDEKSQQALSIAEQIAANLSEVEVARAKKMAESLTEAGDTLQSAREYLEEATESAKGAAKAAVDLGATEVRIAEALGVTRLTVRKWLGKS